MELNNVIVMVVCVISFSVVLWQFCKLRIDVKYDEFIERYEKWCKYHGFYLRHRFVINNLGNVVSQKTIHAKNFNEFVTITLDVVLKVRGERVICKVLYCFGASLSHRTFWNEGKYIGPKGLLKIVKQDFSNIELYKVAGIRNVHYRYDTDETIKTFALDFLAESKAKIDPKIIAVIKAA